MSKFFYLVYYTDQEWCRSGTADFIAAPSRKRFNYFIVACKPDDTNSIIVMNTALSQKTRRTTEPWLEKCCKQKIFVYCILLKNPSLSIVGQCTTFY